MTSVEGGDDTVITLRPRSAQVVSDEPPKTPETLPQELVSPPSTDPISFSRITTWIGCGEKFRLKYVQNAPRQPMGFYIGGGTVHAVIEEAEKAGRQTDIDWLRQRFVEEFNERLAEVQDVKWGGRASKRYPDKENATWWLDNGPLMLGYYALTRHEDNQAGWVLPVERVEAKILTPLPSGTPLLGYMDAFPIDADGRQIIRDYKTGRVGSGSGLQLATYAWAWRQLSGHLITEGEYVFLRTPDASKRRMKVDLAPLLPLVPHLFNTFERAHAAGIYHINASDFCKSCEVRTSCAYGQTLEG